MFPKESERSSYECGKRSLTRYMEKSTSANDSDSTKW